MSISGMINRFKEARHERTIEKLNAQPDIFEQTYEEVCDNGKD